MGCAILGNDELTVGRVDEIELSQGFFDYTEKYTLKTSKIHMPARVDEITERRIQKVAKTIYRALAGSRLRPGGSLPDSRSENRVQRGQYDPRLHLPQPLSEYDEAHRPLFPGNAGKTPGFIPGKNR